MLVPALLAFAVQAHAQSARSSAGSSAGGRAQTATRSTTGGTGGSSSGSSTGPRQYRSNTLLGDATIQIDPETRSLIVVTDDETHSELSKVIKTLDKPKPQVLIKVVFIEVTYNKGSDIGLEGSYAFNMKNPVNAITGASTTTTTGTVTDPVTGAVTNTNNVVTANTSTAATLGNLASASSLFGLAQATDGSFIRVVGDDWQATLRLLATQGKLEVLSRPSIMARNNQEAVIVVGQEVPFVTNSRVTSDGQTINTIQYDNVGIILRVTPFITSEGSVEMIVAPEISTLTSQTVPISNTASAPVIAKRSAETVVVTPNAQTVVIGGLMETQKTEAVRKIPLLGDIPYLGAAFRRTIKDSVKRELMIFLTPYIVNSDKGLKDLTAVEAEEAELIHKAFTDKQLAKFVDLPKLDPMPVVINAAASSTAVKANIKQPEVRRAVRLQRAAK